MTLDSPALRQAAPARPWGKTQRLLSGLGSSPASRRAAAAAAARPRRGGEVNVLGRHCGALAPGRRAPALAPRRAREERGGARLIIPRPSARAPFPPAWGDARMVTARPGHVWRSRGVHGAGVGRTRRRLPAWGPCRCLPADVTGGSVGGSGSASARRRRLQRIAGAGWRPLGWKWLASRPAGDAVGPRRVRWHKQEASEASARHACTWQAVAVGLLARLPRSVGALHGVARCACVCSGCERCD